MGFPYFGALLGFFGGFAFAPTTYFVSMQIYVLTMNDIMKLQPSYVGEMCVYRCLASFRFWSTNQKYSTHLGSSIG